MATFTRKKLAFLQLPSSKGDIYDPPSNTIGLVHNIVIHNTNSSPETVVLNLHDGTNEYQIFSIVATSGETVLLDFRGEGLVVDASSKITGNTTTSSKVTCLITGSEESS